MLGLRSSLTELLSSHQRQETDGRAQLQKDCVFSGKVPTVCCKQRHQHSAAALHGAAAWCQWMDDLAAHAACGDAISERTCLALLPAMYGCLFQDLLAVIEEKCTKNSLCSPKSYICEVCCGTCTIISFPEAPHCPVSLLNSPFQSGHLNDEEVL